MNGLLQLMRPKCPECAGSVEWFGVGEAFDAFGAELVNQFLEMLDVTDDSGEVDFWRCRKCGETGALAS